MHNAFLQVSAITAEDVCAVLPLVRIHMDRRIRAGNGIPTFEQALEIIRDILKERYHKQVALQVIRDVLRLHLFSLASQGNLGHMPFYNQERSNDEIADLLHLSTTPYSGSRRRIERVQHFLKPRTLHSFLGEIFGKNGQCTSSPPPSTLRRAPVHRKRRSSFSYA